VLIEYEYECVDEYVYVYDKGTTDRLRMDAVS
jgi:hypothetical protein